MDFSLSKSFNLPRGLETLLSWDKIESPHHTKPEYIKIMKDGKYDVIYRVNWTSGVPKTTQPLRVTIYRISKDYALDILHSHVTVCINQMVKLNKTFQFELVLGERICIGVQNYSDIDFSITDAALTVRLT